MYVSKPRSKIKRNAIRQHDQLANVIPIVKGLWMGIICGLTVQVMALVTVNLCTDWKKEVRNFMLSLKDDYVLPHLLSL